MNDPITSSDELREELGFVLDRVQEHSFLHGRTDDPDDPVQSVPNDDEDWNLTATDLIAEMMAGAYPHGVVVEIHGYQLRNRRVEGDNVWEVYAPDGGLVIFALNLGAFRTASEVETYLLEGPHTHKGRGAGRDD